MLAKADFAPALTERHKNNQSQKSFTTILRQPAAKLLTAGQNLLTLLTVVSGLPDSLENLDEMGIYLGPPHE